MLSVALWHHLSFLVISTAMLGFGASGVVLALSTGLRERAPLDRTLAMLSISFGATTIASFWVVQHIPFHLFTIPDRLLQDVFTLPLYFLALALPFFWSGLVIALLLTRGAQRVNRLMPPTWLEQERAVLLYLWCCLCSGGQERWSLPRASVF